MDSWSCGVTKKIQPDDRVFLIKLGSEPRGIVASGWATSEVYSAKHWNKQTETKGKKALYIEVKFDTILDPSLSIFPRSRLKQDIFAQMHWDVQSSGVTIPNDIAAELEDEWAQFTNQPVPVGVEILAEEAEIGQTYIEGARKQITINSYERSAIGRSICVKHYGYYCFVCGFNFEKVYGDIGKNFIHVHHLKPLAEIGSYYQLNPITDLRPLCPNCHEMIHKRQPAFSIDELKAIIKATLE